MTDRDAPESRIEWYVECLRSAWLGKPVRGMDEARAGYDVALAALVAEREALLAERDEALRIAEDSWRVAWAKAQRDWHSTAVEKLPAAEARVAVLEAALREIVAMHPVDSGLRGGDVARAVLAGGDAAATYLNPEVGPPFVEHSTYTTGDVLGGDEVATSGGGS